MDLRGVYERTHQVVSRSITQQARDTLRQPQRPRNVHPHEWQEDSVAQPGRAQMQLPPLPALCFRRYDLALEAERARRLEPPHEHVTKCRRGCEHAALLRSPRQRLPLQRQR